MKETKAKIEFDKHGNRRVLNYNGVWANHVDSDGKILHVDIDGKVIERPKSEYPYSYSAFCIFNASQKKLDAVKKDSLDTFSVYTDRLFSENPSKFNSAALSVFENKSQYFDNKDPSLIEKFLQVYYSDTSICLLKIIEECNVSNGFPTWYFKYSSSSSVQQTTVVD